MLNKTGFIAVVFGGGILLSAAGYAPAGSCEDKHVLSWRAIVTGYGNPRAETSAFWDQKGWEQTLRDISGDDFNVVLWTGVNDLQGGDHVFTRLEEFPEARELPVKKNEQIIEQMRWLTGKANKLGLRNFLYTQVIFYTKAFAKAHGLDEYLAESPTVSPYHNYETYPYHRRCGVRNELTRAYVEALYAEFTRLYPDLDGYYAPLGEPLPGDKSTFYKEAIVPGVLRSGRKPLIIAHNMGIRFEPYVKNVAPKEIYDNTWMAMHATNAEQITDAKPYPAVIDYAERVGIPTVLAVYPANVLLFPFNSPKFAAQIVVELTKIKNVVGYAYWQHGNKRFSPLFRKALGYYAKTGENYSDERWVALLQEKFGDREAAQHFLKAYNISGRIIPEFTALILHGGDVQRRELRLPYRFLADYAEGPTSWMTSPSRARPLVPVTYYAKICAQRPDLRDENSTPPPHERWIGIAPSQGGLVYDILPTEHMQKVRAMGEQCLAEAEEALTTVKKNQAEAQLARDWMKAYQLISRYYERKVSAAIAALIYKYAQRPEDRAEAERLADETLSCYLEAANFMLEKIDPIRPMVEEGNRLPKLVELEKQERKDFAKFYKWPEATP